MHTHTYTHTPTHPQANYWADIAYLKEKMDAGADFIVTQLFYEVERYTQFVADCRSVGITAPILPGIMPIMAYGGFKRMTGFCKTAVPKAVSDKMEEIKDDEDAVKRFGVELGADICRKLLAAGAPGASGGPLRAARHDRLHAGASGAWSWPPGACCWLAALPDAPRAPTHPPPPGLHMYTLNLERSAVGILEAVGLLDTSKVPRPLPWRHVPASGQRAQERVRPIFWSNRPRSYISRTANWDAFPNGAARRRPLLPSCLQPQLSSSLQPQLLAACDWLPAATYTAQLLSASWLLAAASA